MKLSIAIAVLLLALVAMLGLNRKKGPLAVATTVTPAVTPAISSTPPPAEARRAAAAPVAVAVEPKIAYVGEHEVELPPGTRNATPEEVAHMQRVKKHMDLRYLESSPAKNTPEARQIEAMLAVRGVDRSAVPTAYNIAWNYHLIYANGKTPERIAKRVVQDKVDELNRTGKLGADFWEQLFQIKPTVFFGQKDFNSPAPGEPMLDK